MKVKVLKKFTTNKDWKKGQVVHFVNELALELIKEGKVERTDEDDQMEAFLKEQEAQ